MSTDYVLSIDFGTQSVRTIIYDDRGNEIDKAKVPFEPYFSLSSGWAEQHPEVYWNSLVKAISILKEDYPLGFDRIVAVGVTTIRDTITFMDKDRNILRPFIVWLDERECSRVEEAIPLPYRAELRLAGMYEPFCNIRRATKINWVHENEPDIWAKTDKIVQLSGYINYKLTGELRDSVASQIGHLPFDYKKQCWQTKKTVNRFLFDCDASKMVDIVDSTKLIGRISAAAAAETGLKEGLPVIACGSDKGCETFGTGTLDNGRASVSMGTTATVQITTRNYVEPEQFMPAYPAVIKGMYNPEVEIFRGCWMVTWFKEQFGGPEVAAAKEKGCAPEQLLDDLLDKVPIGCEGLVLQPYWSPKIKQPCAKGTIIGFSDVHTRAHIYRAIIEGIGFGLYEGLTSICARARTTPSSVMISGGGSNSDRVCKILADILGLPVRKTQTYENSALGCAMLTYMGLGVYKTPEEAIRHMVREGACYEPDMKNHEQYKVLFSTVYERIYRKNRKTFANIRAYNRRFPVPRS